MVAFSHLFDTPVQRCSGAGLENCLLLSEAQHASPYPFAFLLIFKALIVIIEVGFELEPF